MNPLTALLSFSAFRPDPLDIESTISSRFLARKLLGVLKLGTNRIIVASVAKHSWRVILATFDAEGKPAFSDEQFCQVADRDKFNDWLRAYAASHKTTYIAVGVGHGFSVSALSSVSILADVETMKVMRNEPTTLFPDDKSTDHVNALVHHPEASNSSARFKVRATEISQIAEVCNVAGLQLVRIVSEQAQMLHLAYASGLSAAKEVRALLITLPSSYMFLRADHEGWHSILYDPSVDETSASSIAAAISDALPPGESGRLAYVDGGMADFNNLIGEIPETRKFDVMNKNPHVVFYATVLN